MSRVPPLLPEEAYARVVRTARLDGLGVLGVAGLFALLAAGGGDRMGAVVGLLIAGGGALELHGVTLLHHGEARGTKWLIWSQLYLLLAILGYCVFRLLNVDLTTLRMAVTDEMKTQLATTGWGVDEFVLFAYRTSWIAVAVLTVGYQGSMALYYARRRRAVMQALEEEPVEEA